MRTAARDRVVGTAGAAGMLLMIGWALLVGLGGDRPPAAAPSGPLVLIESKLSPPPQQRPRAIPRVSKPSARGAPPNLKNRATPFEAPPQPPLPPPPTIVAAEKPATGLAPETGDAAKPGPGSGTGGTGSGRGGGAGGDGEGDTPPRQIGGTLDFSDVPRALRDRGVGGTVAVRYHVEPDGRVRDCAIDASSGNAALDVLTCALIERRFRFVPALDDAGRPFRSVVVQRHSWINELGARGKGLALDQ